MCHRRLLGGIVILLLSGSAVAHAQLSLVPGPEYRAAVWLRVGFTSERMVLFGLSGELIPGTVGIEISPGSRLGLVRIFAGLKDGVPLEPQTCSYWVGALATGVVAFGPRQPFHFGMRLGAQVEHIPIGDSGTGVLTYPRFADGLSYRFSWFPGAGHLHDGGIDLGLAWAPHAYCQSD
jgi:hypothetical protein